MLKKANEPINPKTPASVPQLVIQAPLGAISTEPPWYPSHHVFSRMLMLGMIK
ncbi:hypothetical protein Tsubulata_012167 [Turnera subulata]|uniref:Uncharacterized protein n=1 Tax=Turnera subulata TaxID=218843 RepID=A0A9Q0GGI0_9ROSI|nr:hypothetical protein Tsubulata_012167 [Turnera subulata]